MIGRVVTTLGIWIVIMSALVAILTNPAVDIRSATDGVLLLVGITILMAAATISTVAIWRGAHLESQEQSLAHLAKAKRVGRDRIDRLIESLNDHEIYELEERLLSHSGSRRND
jgi:uncharacterized membrane protein YbhN (UPF0104 family)